MIWCEDHARLAYFRSEAVTVTSQHDFGPGDLVEFEVREENDLRLAVSPSIVAEDHYPGLADELIRAGQSTQPELKTTRKAAGLPGQENGGCHVVAFPGLFDRPGVANAEHGTSGRKVG
ncbi:MAG: hypothetical protein AAF280_07850 [Pseudomonadota bacterium]